MPTHCLHIAYTLKTYFSNKLMNDLLENNKSYQ